VVGYLSQSRPGYVAKNDENSVSPKNEQKYFPSDNSTKAPLDRIPARVAVLLSNIYRSVLSGKSNQIGMDFLSITIEQISIYLRRAI
jgi:hypothetical protein